MKLKSIVTTMIIAGAASSTAFAADGNMQAQLDAMKAQMAQMQAAIDANNSGTGLPTQNWFNRISVGGMLNIDGNVANRSPIHTDDTRSPSSLAINNANIFIDAQVSDWTKAHIGAVYGDKNRDFNLLRAGAFNTSQYDSSVGAFIDEAYVTIGNFAKNPAYAKFGKQYMPFGSYKPYADITPSLTQALSQVNATGAEAGFVSTAGVHGDLFAFSGLDKVSGNHSTNVVRNYGAGLGFDKVVRNVGVNAGVQYLYNMADVTSLTYALTSNGSNSGAGKYTNAVGGLAANLGLTYKAFDASAKYVSALSRFNTADGIYSNANLNQGARPSAWGVDAGYSFPVRNHDSRFGLGYQGSRQTAYINNPDFLNASGFSKTRYLANYTVNVSKYTDLGFEIRHDKGFNAANGGAGTSANTGTVRLAVKFA